MKVGIDSYCYHRFFGEVYPQQLQPPSPMSLEHFLRRARELEVDGVSLESCFFPCLDRSYLAGIKSVLDLYGLDRVYAWGHPDGLEGGTNQQAYADMVASLERAGQSARMSARCRQQPYVSQPAARASNSSGSLGCSPRRFRSPSNMVSAWRWKITLTSRQMKCFGC